jgi:hypothetical protein
MAGWGRRRCFPERPATVSKRPAGTPCHWPGWPARGLSPGSMSLRWQLKPCVLSRGPVQRPSASARTPRVASPPSGSDTLSATPAGPPGARLLAGGVRPWAAPPRLNTSSVKHRAVRFPNLPHAASVSNRHSKIPCQPGGCTRGARPFRLCGACHAPWPSAGWQPLASSPVALPRAN